MPVEAAGRVLEVLSVSFETLQKAPARPRASGSCREGFGGAIRQFRFGGRHSFGTLQKAVAGRPREQAKRARNEQQMPVEAAGRVLEVLSGSFETLQKAVAGRPREPGASS